MNINHHYYVIPGVVDAQKCHEDADRRRRDKRTLETSIVHHHTKGEDCNNKCTTYGLQEESNAVS